MNILGNAIGALKTSEIPQVQISTARLGDWVEATLADR